MDMIIMDMIIIYLISVILSTVLLYRAIRIEGTSPMDISFEKQREFDKVRDGSENSLEKDRRLFLKKENKRKLIKSFIISLIPFLNYLFAMVLIAVLILTIIIFVLGDELF